MNQDSFSCDSLEEENIISRASPKSYEQSNQAGRSRFSILSDINDANIPNKKTEEQSLLSKYMRDLHDEQAENPIKNNNNQPNREYRNDQNNKQTRKTEDVRNREANQYDWKRKNGTHCSIENVDNSNRLNTISESSRCSKKQSETYGIFLYKMKIDLNKPIDFSLQQQENIHRNYGESRNSSKLLHKDKSEEDMLFGKALRQQHHNHSKNKRY